VQVGLNSQGGGGDDCPWVLSIKRRAYPSRQAVGKQLGKGPSACGGGGWIGPKGWTPPASFLRVSYGSPGFHSGWCHLRRRVTGNPWGDVRCPWPAALPWGCPGAAPWPGAMKGVGMGVPRKGSTGPYHWGPQGSQWGPQGPHCAAAAAAAAHCCCCCCMACHSCGGGEGGPSERASPPPPPSPQPRATAGGGGRGGRAR